MKSTLFRNIAQKRMVAWHRQQEVEKRSRDDNTLNLSGFPHAKTIGEAIGTSRNKKHCASKLHRREVGDSYDPHVLTRGSKKKVFLRPKVPVAVQRYCNQLCLRSSVQPNLVRGGLPQSELASAQAHLPPISL